MHRTRDQLGPPATRVVVAANAGALAVVAGVEVTFGPAHERGTTGTSGRSSPAGAAMTGPQIPQARTTSFASNLAVRVRAPWIRASWISGGDSGLVDEVRAGPGRAVPQCRSDTSAPAVPSSGYSTPPTHPRGAISSGAWDGLLGVERPGRKTGRAGQRGPPVQLIQLSFGECDLQTADPLEAGYRSLAALLVVSDAGHRQVGQYGCFRSAGRRNPARARSSPAAGLPGRPRAPSPRPGRPRPGRPPRGPDAASAHNQMRRVIAVSDQSGWPGALSTCTAMAPSPRARSVRTSGSRPRGEDGLCSVPRERRTYHRREGSALSLLTACRHGVDHRPT